MTADPDERSPVRRALAALATRRGRRILSLALFAALACVGAWFFSRMPREGTVEVRWEGRAPEAIFIRYIDIRGNERGYRQERIAPGGRGVLRDTYNLPPGEYWVVIGVRDAAGTRKTRRRVELPASQPIVFRLDDLP